ncbi:Uncharacterised protein [BD1-7 clade bacterium]|uniref:Transmembrane protein EpsG n=1 Tax=BD1-7 clade bacterium TaxID=2029982 RepID=A0A5S9MWE7_9GAMM|nr:Uncharacterised protein [BD1-7 clade bacterium]
MLVYWLMFLLPAVAALMMSKVDVGVQRLGLMFVCGALFIVVGFRYQVGCDWGAYEHHYDATGYVTSWVDWRLVSTDPGYALVNIVSAALGGGVVGVNLICALISLSGLYAFSRRQPNPFLAITIAIPYIVIVLFQGYTRQAVAFGLELFALSAIADGKLRKYVVMILLAATFHKSAVVLLPLVALAGTRNRWWSVLWVGSISVLAYITFLSEHQDRMWAAYVEENMQSSGGELRVIMNALPAILLLFFRKHFRYHNELEKNVWFLLAVISIVCIPLVSVASTATDRFALYLMPLQLFVLCRLNDVASFFKSVSSIAVITLYFFVQFVWLNYSHHAFCWVPYKSWLFE